MPIEELSSLNISEEDILKLGNIDKMIDQYGKPYTFIRRSSVPVGILHHKDMALKIYHMRRKTEPMPQNLIDSLESFLISEIDAGQLEYAQGIGFAILSQGFLSINIWGRGNVLFTQTYTVEKNPAKLSREPLEKTGVACTWEAKIMHHEYEQWHSYMMSGMTIADKRTYLQSFISGDL